MARRSLSITVVAATAAEPELKPLRLKVGADRREALVHWPAAVCVYMQGLPAPTKSDSAGLKPVWQNAADTQGDRDLKFFDAALAEVKKTADAKRVYAAGFSNGGGFTYLLIAERGGALAGIAPGGIGSARKAKDLKPMPCLHFAGRNDERVAFARQEESMAAVRKANGCDAAGKPWPGGGKVFTCTLYPSKTAPFVSAVHDGGHEVPKPTGRLIAKFFKEN